MVGERSRGLATVRVPHDTAPCGAASAGSKAPRFTLTDDRDCGSGSAQGEERRPQIVQEVNDVPVSGGLGE